MRYTHHNKHRLNLTFGALAQLGERDAGSVEVSGSNPLCSTIGSVAQLVEHHLDMVVVVGSSPIGATIYQTPRALSQLTQRLKGFYDQFFQL